jgi:hypothetical protein
MATHANTVTEQFAPSVRAPLPSSPSQVSASWSPTSFTRLAQKPKQSSIRRKFGRRCSIRDGGGINWTAKRFGLRGVRGPVRAFGTRSKFGRENLPAPELRTGRAGELQDFRRRQAISPAHLQEPPPLRVSGHTLLHRSASIRTIVTGKMTPTSLHLGVNTAMTRALTATQMRPGRAKRTRRSSIMSTSTSTSSASTTIGGKAATTTTTTATANKMGQPLTRLRAPPRKTGGDEDQRKPRWTRMS